jgi:class 3 adenylate cyclase
LCGSRCSGIVLAVTDETRGERTVDELIRARKQKRAELQGLGDRIRASGREIVIAFVDLADSTLLKTKFDPDEWLGYVHQFLATVDEHTRASGGTVVKRIGDELMGTFPTATSAESFLDRMEADSTLPPTSYKIAVDSGEAYHLNFGEHLADDPYGTVVDRCARIAKLAMAGAVLVSSEYRRLVLTDRYVSAGTFWMKGLAEPHEVFIRAPAPPDPQYLKPLLQALNETSRRIEGYSFLPRSFTGDYLIQMGSSNARPFIARSLLNVPRLAETPQQFEKRFMAAGGLPPGEINGYFIEWEVVFETFLASRDEIKVTLHIPGNDFLKTINVALPGSMLEVVRTFVRGGHLKLRGIVTELLIFTFRVTYADFEVL